MRPRRSPELALWLPCLTPSARRARTQVQTPLDTTATVVLAALGAVLALCGLAAVRARTHRSQALLQQALAEVRAEKEWYSLVLSSITEEVYYTDLDKRYTYANSAVLREFGHELIEGVPVESIVSHLEVLRPDGTPRPMEEAPPLRALGGEVIHNEEQIVRNPRTGELRHRQVSSAPVRNQDGAIIGSVSVARDITERKRVEDALRDSDRRKDLFIATLSHELRNPLAPIRTAAKLLESPQLGQAERERCALIIGRQVGHLASLLDDLLDASRLSRGDFRLQLQTVPVETLVEAALEAAQPAIAAKRHRLEVVMTSLPLAIHVDPVRMTQVISNLLTNAARYTDPGGMITLALELDEEALDIRVTDNGLGLPLEAPARIFEMFVQLDVAKQRGEGGLGIGLALVKALVEMHGGNVSVHSAGLNRGSTFSVRLPRSCIQVAAQTCTAGSTPTRALSDRSRVLVADDNADGAQTIAMFLRNGGHEVVTVHNGQDAVEVANSMRPDIALLDIGMPGLSGYQVARNIRSQSWGSTVMLIAMTGWGREQDRRAAAESGFDRHLTKPVDLDALRSLVVRTEAARCEPRAR